MKKFIKKTIAGLIAGVMAISSMPFTALADTTSDKAFIQSKINSGAPTYATTTSTSGNALSNNSGYMNNILVSGNYDQRTSAQFALNDSVGYSIVAHALDKAVAVYDGTNDVKIPVAVEAKDGYCGANITVYAGIDHVDLKNGGQFSLGNDTWIRANSWTDYGDSSDTSHDFSTDDTVNKTRGNSATGYFQVFTKNLFGSSTNTPKQWKNYITFTPDSSFDKTYYASLTTLTYKCQADIFAQWTGGKGNKQDIAADTSDYTVDYKVINYKPLKNLLDDVDGDLKNTFNTVSANESDYDASTVSAYYSALAELYRFNLTDGLTVGTVATKAEKMGALIEAYKTAKGNLKKLPQIDQSYIDSYNNALAEAEAKVNEADKYTADSIDALNTVIADVKAKRDGVKTNEELDKLTTSLLTAISNLVQTKFTVKFVKIGKDTNPVEEPEKTVKYGDTFQANAGANVKGWIVKTNGDKTKTRLNTLNQEVSVVITEDTTIEAYLSGEEATETSSKATFYGRHNQVVAIKYVADGQPLDTSDVEVPKVPFYDFVKWDVSKTDDGKEYIVKAVYKCIQAENDKCIVHFDGKDKAYTYNSYVYLFGADKSKKYALYDENDKLLVALDGVDFYTPQRKHIYVKEYKGTEEANVAVMGSFATKKDGQNTAVYNCKFNLPEGATAIEWGVAIKFDNGSVKKFSIKEKSKRNEYSANVKAPATIKNVTAAAYVTYKQGETEETKMSDFVTVDLSTL